RARRPAGEGRSGDAERPRGARCDRRLHGHRRRARRHPARAGDGRASASAMTRGVDAADALGRLWRTWASTFAHDLRAPLSLAAGYGRMLQQSPDVAQQPRMLEEQERAFSAIGSAIAAMVACSRGRARVDELVTGFAHLYGSRLFVTRTGDLSANSPNDQLGLILWLLLHAQRQRETLTLDVAVTNTAGRIAIGPAKQAEAEAWTTIDTIKDERWWLFDAVDYLRLCGHSVDVR